MKPRIDQQISQLGSLPFSKGVLLELLAGYKRPNDKISRLMDEGVLQPLKKGWYLVGEAYRQAPVNTFLVANLLYGPSCVSLQSALSWHGWIPEAVQEVTSVTTRRSKLLETSLGRLSYLTLPRGVFSSGIQLQEDEQGHFFWIACPEKALCDLLLLTSNLQLRSFSALEVFLEEDLRLDMDEMKAFDQRVLAAYLEAGRKQQVFELLQSWLEVRL